MASFIGALKVMAERLAIVAASLRSRFETIDNRRKAAARPRRGVSHRPFSLEALESRAMMAADVTTAIASGDWFDANTWDNGVPDGDERAIIGHGLTVELDAREGIGGTDFAAGELVVQGKLVVTEEPSYLNKTLTTRWVHVNSGGEFRVGSEADRYDGDATFTLTLTGTDVFATHVIETNPGGNNPSTRTVSNNDGFLMTFGGGRLQLFGEEKLSFTKLSATAEANATTITVENVIERNYSNGDPTANGGFLTSAEDDGALDWEVGDQIVIASSSYDYRDEDVRTIVAIVDNGETSTLTLDEPLDHRHYGEIESYGPTHSGDAYEIDLRAEVALLSRNIKIQGLQGPESQDTDVEFGDRQNVQQAPRTSRRGLSPDELVSSTYVTNGVGGHLMFMPNSGQVNVDGVQLDGLGQASQKGRYPIHWHLGGERENHSLRNSSITNSNNRGVTIHGSSGVKVEGVVLHDIHGHGFFFEDAVETGNELVANIAFGIHLVGGDAGDGQPGVTDPFVVDTHDNARQADSRFKSSAAFWITNPNNTFVGNISAGASGTGFWYAIPRSALGGSASSGDYDGYNPIFEEFGQFDYNTSHSTPVGLNFDRGSDIEDARPAGFPLLSNNSDQYSPREGGVAGGAPTTNYVNGFTAYKATDAAFYHRGERDTILLRDTRVADSYNSVWAVSETQYEDSLFVGHSRGNADEDAFVGGPRLYDGAGLYTNTHFAGFDRGPVDQDNKAFAFQVEGSSFGPTLYHAFRGTSFEDDGTYSNLAHAVSDFPDRDVIKTEHDLGQPARWIKGVLDLDGTLTGAAGGGGGYSIVPNVDFLRDADDTQPLGWDAWLTNDLYTRIRITNDNNGDPLFPSEVTGEPLVRFTSQDGDSIDVVGGQNLGTNSWIQAAAKVDSDGDNLVEGTFTIEFGRNGLPAGGFAIETRNQDGGLPELVPSIQERVTNARIVVRVVAAANYLPEPGKATEVFSEAELRRADHQGTVYYRDAATGDLYYNAGIDNPPFNILATPDPETPALQTPFTQRTIEFGATVQAEEFDRGIEGIAYRDSDATNSLGSFRDDTGVDATPTSVGSVVNGEWLEYTAEIVPAGYRVGVNLASTGGGGRLRLLAANSNSAGFLREVGAVDVPDTQGQPLTVWMAAVDLAPFAGPDSVVRLQFDDPDGDAGALELDSLRFESPVQTAYLELQEDRVIRAIAGSSTRIELEEYDEGGQGVAYNDTTPGNDSSNDFRTDQDVDASSSIVTNDVREGEWLEYTTDIQAGVYDIVLGRAWSGDDDGVRIFVGESNSATELTELGEIIFSDGNQLEEFTLEGVDLSPWAGQDRVIRVEIIGQFMGLDYLRFDPKTETVSGDYNRDNTVNTADFVLWRDTLNTGVTELSGADGNGDGAINTLDHGVWQSNFGLAFTPPAEAQALVADTPARGSLSGLSREHRAIDAAFAWIESPMADDTPVEAELLQSSPEATPFGNDDLLLLALAQADDPATQDELSETFPQVDEDDAPRRFALEIF